MDASETPPAAPARSTRQLSLISALLTVLVCTLTADGLRQESAVPLSPAATAFAEQTGDLAATPEAVHAAASQDPAAVPEDTDAARSLTEATGQRDALLSRTVNLHVLSGDGILQAEIPVAIGDHPEWVSIAAHWGRAYPQLEIDRIRTDLQAMLEVFARKPVDCTLTSVSPDEDKVIRGQTVPAGAAEASGGCVAVGGYGVDTTLAVHSLVDAIQSGTPDAQLTIAAIPAHITDARTPDGGTLMLLGQGHSDFSGSPLGRAGNVRKALTDKVNNVLVPAGATFSFNQTLDAPIDADKGWYMALAIFDGGRLASVPGGGICQAATTLYRSVLAAGLPSPVHKNHSLFVHYYEAHGVGQDATVYPGEQDLTFINDTGHDILIQGRYEGNDAYVALYGIPDGRTVTLAGPYFSKNTPPDLLAGGKSLAVTQIGWQRTIRMADGSEKKEVFVSQYKGLPKTLASQWIAKGN